MNRLQHETSPYLRQHADNPVDWYAWGEEAFARAKAEDKPILLSIGYSACHWCHVMAHESFEDTTTARLMNDLFVNIKVDREERPDVDDIYMTAVQTMTNGSGGWPLTVFLTPEGKPFYGGTYFPREPRYGMPSFQQVLHAVVDAYRTRHEQLEGFAEEVADALRRDELRTGGDTAALTSDLLDAAARALGQSFDRANGGFGGAPKFPQPMNLEFLLRAYARTGDRDALDMATLSLDRMARGGIYDQIGGGFHRYATDAIWLVPHFEKMLYDNAQLSRVYLHAWQITRDPFYRRIAEEVYDYILREMTAPVGGFYSASDADSAGEEGKFFVWTQAEIEQALGRDAPLALAYWGVTARGNFEGETNILHAPTPEREAALATELGLSPDDLRARIADARRVLYDLRSRRTPPGLDDKILTAWNGLMLASLAEAARVFKEARYLAAAVQNADFLLTHLMTPAGRLLRTYKDGQARLNAYLEDYANLIDGLLELYQSTFDERWFVAAQRLADAALDHFAAPDGGFYDTSDDHEPLLVRPRNVQDNALPSGGAMLAKNLLRLAAYTGQARYGEAARGALALLGPLVRRVPQAFGEAAGAIDMLVSGPLEVAIVGDPGLASTRDLLDAVQQPYRPNIITALAPADVPGEATVPLLSFRTLREGQPTVYVCRNFACRRPVTTAAEVEALLQEPHALPGVP